MLRLSKLWTAVGSAIPVTVGSALGGLGLVDVNTMLAIAVIPQAVFLVIGRWPDFQRTTNGQVWDEHEFEHLPRYAVRPLVRRQRRMGGQAMSQALAAFDMNEASLSHSR
jgi:hypothetical protein